ncbi:MAG: hypothetical protein JWQ27_534 [Ferruginibacter sp.]|nr:hypothetical protein [Ferruginibacter sp.]
MKIIVGIARILTGLLFIFSGLVKAIDPRGLAYKMQEFFEAWGSIGSLKGMMQWLDQYALAFSVIMITLEVVVGVALLLGWQKRISTLMLFLLMLFFTFLTSYVLFSGKIRACGCFGDCIPLTPVQTFTKDIILLVLSLLLLLNTRYIHPVAKPWINSGYVLLSMLLTLWLQFYVLKHLPLKDCLPYKVGNNILELRKMPANAIPDKFDYVFVYEKGGVKQDFTTAALPDSSWTFVERKQQLVTKGRNNIPLINDFSFSTVTGIDTTDAILQSNEEYFLLFLKELPANVKVWAPGFKALVEREKGKRKVYIVTAQRNAVEQFLHQYNINADAVFTTDGTAIKTAARSNPTLFRMKGPVVEEKKSWADF